ncbi:hypothetical protein L228DRAFT_244762 [Xylona heveae TC161]|uniref:FAD binding domain-containing protein n=1 Tax=Xylona heveae (strain CBS 132557 / TC161) TaxID=1328760 RepID=A0A165J784_XYLHT|nr:hypothetical protein L228DRAFT_244762 [Xylona heveae TC161]KZF25834.1 hypothetical protein L228DRAFT_244762 [Xylona heveae TC161]
MKRARTDSYSPEANGVIFMANPGAHPTATTNGHTTTNANNNGHGSTENGNGNGKTNGSALRQEPTHVIVAGAGPAGVMLASNLVRFGIKTQIVDDRANRTSTGRADGLQPKTIETLKQLRLAEPLLQKGAKIFDICFWNATPDQTLHRTHREIHYPPFLDVEDPYILLVHQGMVEELFISDLQSRGISVARNTAYTRFSPPSKATSDVQVVFQDRVTGEEKSLRAQYLVGCDGAHSRVRKSIPQMEMQGESGTSAWGVLDGIVDTDFPDLWSKVVIHSETAGTILCIPREKGMTRLYIELTKSGPMSEAATEEFVMNQAREIMKPYSLTWKSVEWFGLYKVGQRVASRFMDESGRVFIAGDAAHTHSPKAAQGMNVSMHDSFNLSWKLNLAIRGLAGANLLATYENERRKIAQDLINFDYEHAQAFSAGDPKALARNFATNIRFIAGVGAEYGKNVLNKPEKTPRGKLRAGSLILPAMVERYVDANPVHLQLDIPMLGQFRIFFFTPNVHLASSFLKKVCAYATSLESVLGRVTDAAEESYKELPFPETDSDYFVQPDRYLPVSKCFTYALVTTMPKSTVEIAHLPPLLQKSKWTFYLDSIKDPTREPCTRKWVGKLEEDEVAIVNVRPDGYVGSIQRWNASAEDEATEACLWLDQYYGRFLIS